MLLNNDPNINPVYSGPGGDQTSGTNMGIWGLYNMFNKGANKGGLSVMGRNVIQFRAEVINKSVVSGKDGINLDNYQGCIIGGIFGKSSTAANGWVNITQLAGYLAIGVNNVDSILMAKNQTNGFYTTAITNFSLTGVGSSVEWNTADIDNTVPVYVWYYKNAAFCLQREDLDLIYFKTIGGQSLYELGSELITMHVAYVIYGSTIIKPNQLVQNYDQLTINPGGPVIDGVTCFVVPVGNKRRFVTQANQYKYYVGKVDPSEIAYVVYGDVILNNGQWSLTGNGNYVDFMTLSVGGPITPGLTVYLVHYEKQIPFKSVALQNTYNLGGALDGIIPAYVIYGSSIINNTKFSVAGNMLTIDVGGPVKGDLSCYVVPLY